MCNIPFSEASESIDDRSASSSSRRCPTVSESSSIDIPNIVEEKPYSDEQRSALSIEYDFEESSMALITSATPTEDEGI